MSYPGHVPPKKQRDRWMVVGMAILAAAICLLGIVIGRVTATETTTVTHIDQMASACEELQ